MKRIIFFFLLFFANQIYAYPYTEDNYYFFSDALVWQLREGSADNWAQEISPVGIHQTTRILGVPFKWKPGVRLGIGHYNFCDDWDMVFSYTWYQTKGKNQATVSSGGIYSPFLGNFFVNNVDGANFGPNYRHANVQWKVQLNIVDLEMGHSFKIDEFLELRPFFGLKASFINRHIHSNWQNPNTAVNFTTANEILKNKFWGIGPSLGLNTTWSLYRLPLSSFNLFGNFSGAVLGGNWRFKDVYQNNTPNTVSVHLKPIKGASTMARALLGIEWVGCIAGANMAFRMGYEAQVWFNQIQYYSLNMGRLSNLMSLQGGVLGFELYF